MNPQDIDPKAVLRILNENLGTVIVQNNNVVISYTDHDAMSGKAKGIVTAEVPVSLIEGYLENLKTDISSIQEVHDNWYNLLEKLNNE